MSTQECGTIREKRYDYTIECGHVDAALAGASPVSNQPFTQSIHRRRFRRCMPCRGNSLPRDAPKTHAVTNVTSKNYRSLEHCQRRELDNNNQYLNKRCYNIATNAYL